MLVQTNEFTLHNGPTHVNEIYRKNMDNVIYKPTWNNNNKYGITWVKGNSSNPTQVRINWKRVGINVNTKKANVTFSLQLLEGESKTETENKELTIDLKNLNFIQTLDDFKWFMSNTVNSNFVINLPNPDDDWIHKETRWQGARAVLQRAWSNSRNISDYYKSYLLYASGGYYLNDQDSKYIFTATEDTDMNSDETLVSFMDRKLREYGFFKEGQEILKIWVYIRISDVSEGSPIKMKFSADSIGFGFTKSQELNYGIYIPAGENIPGTLSNREVTVTIK